MPKDINWTLIQNYLTDQCSQAEKEQLVEWMHENDYNKRFMEKIKKIWDVTPKKEFEVDEQQAWRDFKHDVIQNLSKKRATNNGTQKTKPGSFSSLNTNKKTGSWVTFLRIAAIVVLSVLLGALVSHYLEENQTSPKDALAMQKLVTQRGEKAGVTFSDGTKVILNAASTLKFPKQFTGNKRLVYLDGEAYFEVAHNKQLPFLVKTNKAQVQVLGTKFDVKAWSKDKEASVTVRQGTVAVTSNDSVVKNRRVVLNKNENTVVKLGKSLYVSRVESKKLLNWLNGGLYFKDTPFAEVIKQIERKFDVDIEVKDQDLLTVPFNGEFSQAKLSEILDVLRRSMNISVVWNKEMIYISKSK